MNGVPAAGIPVTLARLAPSGASEDLATAATNADGRCTTADLLRSGAVVLTPGTYELRFDVAAYLAARCSSPHARPPLYDVIPIRFNVHDVGSHFHIPLLLAPFGYSTYRGS